MTTIRRLRGRPQPSRAGTGRRWAGPGGGLTTKVHLLADSGCRPLARVTSAGQARNRLRRGRKGGRPPAFSPEAYKQRNTVERAFSKLRQHRAVATRYDKRDFVYRGTVDVAAIRVWLRDPVP
jgi:transposase